MVVSERGEDLEDAEAGSGGEGHLVFLLGWGDCSGLHFVMVLEPEEAAPEARQIVYVPDFAEELKAKMAAAVQ